MSPPRFVVDTMLGRLARWLRALGYDTLYLGQAEDRRLRQLALAEDRILLTRDVRLARLAEPRGCLIRSELVDQQLVEVVDALALAPQERDWLSRCLECNAALVRCEKETLRGRVPQHVFATQQEFVACPGCGRVYWAGTHADRMLERLARLLRRPAPPGAEPGA